LVEFARRQQEHRWDRPGYTYRTLQGQVMGILGLGEIGSVIAQVAKTFGMSTRAYVLDKSKHDGKAADQLFGGEDPAALTSFLGELDYLVNTLPSTSQTKHLLSKLHNGNPTLSYCRKGCTFVNVGRGNIVLEKDLVVALQEGWLGGAILDVFECEPLDKSSLLWDLPNVTITPHVSGMSMASDVATVFADNLELFMKGKNLKYVVNWEKGY